MRYIIRYGELAQQERTQIELEIAQLAQWLHSSGIDPDFVAEDHLYCAGAGEYWIHLPELTAGQLFAMQLVMSSGTVEDG